MTDTTRDATGTAAATAVAVPPGARPAAARPVRGVRRRVARLVRPSALATAGLVLGFAAYALLMGAGSDSMFALSDHLDPDQVSVMAGASVLLTLVAAVALVRRHRRPLAVTFVLGALAVASLLLAGATNGLEIALAIALCAVASARRPRDAWIAAVAVVLPVLVAARLSPVARVVGTRVLDGNPENPTWNRSESLPDPLAELLPPWWTVTAVPLVLLAVAGVVLGSVLRERRLRLAAITDAAVARAAEETQRARVLQADERARIAREMHDVVGHSITVMVALGGGAAAAMDRSPDQARAALDELVDTGRTALDDVRRILGILHAPQDADLAASAAGVGGAGLAPAGASAGASADASTGAVPMAPQPGGTDLARLVERFRTAGLPVRTSGLAVTGLDGLAGTAQLAVYRVVQEALTNTLRHAPGTPQVDVDVRRRPDAVEVVVTDEGPREAVAPSPGSGRGLVGMTERLAAFGGTVEAGPYGQGWRVRALLPQREEGEA